MDDGSVLASEGKYLTFRVAEEAYGVEILKVQEIIGLMEITRVPRTPEFVRGVINLRGKVIPILDLRLKFGLEAAEATEKTCVIVVQLENEGARTVIGIIVDEVSEVLDIERELIEPAPDFGSATSSEYIMGMGKIGQKVLTLLNIDQVLSLNELRIVSDVQQA